MLGPNVIKFKLHSTLKDGVSFKIFQEINVYKPVIFITAYNEYALNAFKVNSIDYLLKPVTFSDLSVSLLKFENLRNQFTMDEAKRERIKSLAASGETQSYKARFMAKVGDHIRSIITDQILFFFADGRYVYLVTIQLRKYIIDFTLEVLENVLEPKIIFRVNRTYIINLSYIHDVVMYSNSRLKITTQPAWDKEIIVSREKVSERGLMGRAEPLETNIDSVQKYVTPSGFWFHSISLSTRIPSLRD